MPSLGIFLMGLLVSAMCVGGLVFTIIETRRLGHDADERALPSPRAGRD